MTFLAQHRETRKVVSVKDKLFLVIINGLVGDASLGEDVLSYKMLSDGINIFLVYISLEYIDIEILA